jgi:hypothetical protein
VFDKTPPGKIIREVKTLNDTRKLKPESVLRAYKKGFGYSQLTVFDVNEYFLGALAPEDFFARVAEGDDLCIYHWKDNTASFEFTLRVLGRIRSAETILILSHTKDIQSGNERKCLKAALGLAVKYYPITINHKNKSFYTEEIIFHRGRIVELGDREAVLEADEALPLTCLVNIHLPLNDNDMEVTGRITAYSSESGEYRYDVEYLGLSEKDRGRILEYVFNALRE